MTIVLLLREKGDRQCEACGGKKYSRKIRRGYTEEKESSSIGARGDGRKKNEYVSTGGGGTCRKRSST